MRRDKEFILRLRHEGRSYRYIQQATGVSRGTLSRWFKEEDWSNRITIRHADQSAERAKERMIKMNMVRNLKLQYQYALVVKEAEKQYAIYKNEPLFWKGLMLYVGHGDKKTRSVLKISSSEFYIHKVFMQFCLAYLEVPREKFRCCLLLYPHNNKEIALKTWSDELNLDSRYFYKTQVIKRRESASRGL